MSNELIPMPLDKLGSVLVKSGFFADVKEEAQAIVKVLAGRELGFGPITSMTNIHIIKGRPAIGASLMAAAIKRSGRYDYKVVEITDKICSIDFWEGGKKIGNSTFTVADAYKAGTGNMSKFPRNMLFARAMSNGAKWYCPNAFNGPVYTPEELGHTQPDENGIIDVVVEPGAGSGKEDVKEETKESPPSADFGQKYVGSAAIDRWNGTPATVGQVEEIKSLALQVYGTEKGITAIKAALANRNKAKLAELTDLEADELILKLKDKLDTSQPRDSF